MFFSAYFSCGFGGFSKKTYVFSGFLRWFACYVFGDFYGSPLFYCDMVGFC